MPYFAKFKQGYIYAHRHNNIWLHSGSYWGRHHMGHYWASCLSIAGSSGPDEEVEHQLSVGTDPCVCDTEQTGTKSWIIITSPQKHCLDLKWESRTGKHDAATQDSALLRKLALSTQTTRPEQFVPPKETEGKATLQYDENKLLICLARRLIYI